MPELQVRAPEVQASLTVLGRGSFGRREGRGDLLDLHAIDLRRARLRGAHLEGAYLLGAHLEGASAEAEVDRAKAALARLPQGPARLALEAVADRSSTARSDRYAPDV